HDRRRPGAVSRNAIGYNYDMSKMLSLPDELFDRLHLAAEQQGTTIEQLLAQWAASAVAGSEGFPDSAVDDDLLVMSTRALLDGTEPPVSVDWGELMSAIQGSE